MSDRNKSIEEFIGQSGMSDWSRETIAKDASARRYLRLRSQSDESRILMDAPPELDCGTEEFIQIAQALEKSGYAVPKVMRSDLASGLLLLSDLGETSLAIALVNHPELEKTEFLKLCELLVLLECEAIPNLQIMTPAVAGQMVRLSAENYASCPELGNELEETVSGLFSEYCGPPTFLSLRDLHSENIILRDENMGKDRFGLLDFQDAFYAPQGYDLVSLLRDVRRDIPTQTVDAATAHYLKLTSSQKNDFHLQFACLAAQRNLRILGVFAKLIRQEKRSKYQKFLERTWNLVSTDLQHPELEQLNRIFTRYFPPPSADLYSKWSL